MPTLYDSLQAWRRTWTGPLQAARWTCHREEAGWVQRALKCQASLAFLVLINQNGSLQMLEAKSTAPLCLQPTSTYWLQEVEMAGPLQDTPRAWTLACSKQPRERWPSRIKGS